MIGQEFSALRPVPCPAAQAGSHPSSSRVSVAIITLINIAYLKITLDVNTALRYVVQYDKIFSRQRD